MTTMNFLDNEKYLLDLLTGNKLLTAGAGEDIFDEKGAAAPASG